MCVCEFIGENDHKCRLFRQFTIEQKTAKGWTESVCLNSSNVHCDEDQQDQRRRSRLRTALNRHQRLERLKRERKALNEGFTKILDAPVFGSDPDELHEKGEHEERRHDDEFVCTCFAYVEECVGSTKCTGIPVDDDCESRLDWTDTKGFRKRENAEKHVRLAMKTINEQHKTTAMELIDDA